jgi:hypothetical protein
MSESIRKGMNLFKEDKKAAQNFKQAVDNRDIEAC